MLLARAVEVLIELGIAHQLPERAFAAVELAAEVGHFAEQFVEPRDGLIDAIDDLFAPFAQGPGEALEVRHVAIDRFDRRSDGGDRRCGCLRATAGSSEIACFRLSRTFVVAKHVFDVGQQLAESCRASARFCSRCGRSARCCRRTVC